MKIVLPGMLATVQDSGRNGFRSMGVMKGGVMDEFAHRIGNILVGNDENAAAIEFTGGSFGVLLEEDCLIAVTGAGSQIFLDDRKIPMWKAAYVSEGTYLSSKPSGAGMRQYLAIAGGWDVKKILNSFSTHLTAGFGGLEGRSLKKNDHLYSTKNFSVVSQKIYSSLPEKGAYEIADWSIAATDLPDYSAHPSVRIIKGAEFLWMKDESALSMFKETFEISDASSRMGYRLAGKKLELKEQRSMISSAVIPGTIQLTPDGSLLLLMADAQTTGGYPRVAQVASVDLPLVGQLKPGDQISFRKISFEEAESLYLKQEEKIKYIRDSIELRFL